jgi:hypothetical protein
MRDQDRLSLSIIRIHGPDPAVSKEQRAFGHSPISRIAASLCPGRSRETRFSFLRRHPRAIASFNAKHSSASDPAIGERNGYRDRNRVKWSALWELSIAGPSFSPVEAART